MTSDYVKTLYTSLASICVEFNQSFIELLNNLSLLAHQQKENYKPVPGADASTSVSSASGTWQTNR